MSPVLADSYLRNVCSAKLVQSWVHCFYAATLGPFFDLEFRFKLELWYHGLANDATASSSDEL